MRSVRRLLLLGLLGLVAAAAFTFEDAWWRRVSGPVDFDPEHAKRQATRVATRAAADARDAAEKVGDRIGETALTAKITSKMALDDRVTARDSDVANPGIRRHAERRCPLCRRACARAATGAGHARDHARGGQAARRDELKSASVHVSGFGIGSAVPRWRSAHT
jgi:hypothetical protein